MDKGRGRVELGVHGAARRQFKLEAHYAADQHRLLGHERKNVNVNMNMNIHILKRSQSVIITLINSLYNIPPRAMSKKTMGLVVALSSLLLLVVIIIIIMLVPK